MLAGAPTNAGTYTVIATFISNDPSYVNASSTAVTFKISPATPNIVVTAAGGIYNGTTAYPALSSVTPKICWSLLILIKDFPSYFVKVITELLISPSLNQRFPFLSS